MTLEEKIQEFVKYRKEIKKPIREASMSSFLKKLEKLSNGNEETAIEILEESIAQGWQGIFPLKNKTISMKPTFADKVMDKQQSLNDLKEQLKNEYRDSKAG